MPKISELSGGTGGEWMKPDDLENGKRYRVIVAGSELTQVKDFNDPDKMNTKLLVHLKNARTGEHMEKSWLANVSSARDIAAVYGEDSDEWAGKPIFLTKHQYPNGKPGIKGEPLMEEADADFGSGTSRVAAGVEQVRSHTTHQEAVQSAATALDDDDIPFS